MNGVIIVGVWGSPVVSAVVWAAALAGLVWMVVPAIAFALRIGGVRTVVLPDVGPPALRGGDGAFEPWSTQLAALGFRHAGRTREIARFMSPTQWSWQSVHPAPWLISPDGETYASMYRIVPNEPVRISAVTAFEGGGIVRTACPGPVPQDGLPPDHHYTFIRGVDANGLLARHREQVAAFANERGAAVRRATIAEIAAINDTALGPLARKINAPSYVRVLACLAGVAALLMPLAHGAQSTVVALEICLLIGVFALMEWLLRGPVLRYNAGRSHTENITGTPDDVTSDGTILATGKYERLLRILAVPAAVLSCAWPIASLRKITDAFGRDGLSIMFSLLFTAASGSVVFRLAGRARGKVWSRKDSRNPASVWTSLLLLNVLFAQFLEWNKGTLHRVLYAVATLSMLLGVVGWALEKKRGK